MEIGQAIVEAMEEMGWTPIQVAAAIGLTEAAVKKWLPPNGSSTPGGETLLKLMRVMEPLRRRLGYRLEAAA